ncbi:MAG: hypothetical protein ACOCP4_01995 [Candidatus Woesearchaeota archaeon]
MENKIKSIGAFISLLIWVCIFILLGYGFGHIHGYNNCLKNINNDLKKWAIEQNYIEYNSKTGDLEIVDKEIEPISKYVLNKNQKGN